MKNPILRLLGLCCCAILLAACIDTPTEFRCSAVVNEQSSVRGDSVFTTSGLVYRDLTVGSGAQVQTADRCQSVEVRYVGRLTNGTVFSQTPGAQTFAFDVGRNLTIRGFEQGVVGMRVGGRRELIIPPSLGYGDREVVGPGVTIPPNSTLIFEIELVSVRD